MGCVWQSEYAPVTRLSDTRMHARPVARHRKPARWRRITWATVPVLTAILAHSRADGGKADGGKVPVLARGR
jgi:hypothetical protein